MAKDLDFRLVLESFSDAVIATDGSDRITYANLAAERLLGWTRSELLGKPLTTLMPARMHAAHEAGYRRYMVTHQARIIGKPIRLPALHKNGTELDIELTLSAFQVNGEDLVVAAMRDLRDRVELERQLVAKQMVEHQYAILHAVFMQLPTPICMTRGKDHVFELINPSGLRLAGKRKLVGRAFREAFPEPEANLFVDWMNQVFETGIPLHKNETPIRLADGKGSFGEEFFLNFVCQPFRGIDAEVEGLIVFALDVTDQVLARQKTQTAEHRARFLGEATALLGSSLDFNATLARLARLSIPSLADFCVVDLVEEDQRIHRVAIAHGDPKKEELLRVLQQHFPPTWSSPQGSARVLRTEQPEMVRQTTEASIEAHAINEEHAELMRRIGLRSHLSVPMRARGKTIGAITLGYAESGRNYDWSDLVLAQDLADRAANAADNARLYGEAQEAIRVRDDFLSVASHELRTPLTPLQINVQSLQRSLQKGNPDEATLQRFSDKLGTIGKQVTRLERLVNSLLDVTRITGKRLLLDSGEVDLVATVKEVVERFQEQAAQLGVPLVFAEANSTQTVVGWWDRLRVDQIAVNLISNAMKFGGKEPCRISVFGDEETATLVVKDSGIGINPEDQQRIFGRFERAVPLRHYSGLGLGLWLTRQLVEAMQGKISVESVPGSGSTFTVTLPRKRPFDGVMAESPIA